MERLTLKGHEAGVVSASFSLDGKRVITASYDGAAKVWTIELDRQEHSLKDRDVAISSDGRFLVASSNDH
jgi:WD40 repeat protein